MIAFSTCAGAKSCPDFCGGVYVCVGLSVGVSPCRLLDWIRSIEYEILLVWKITSLLHKRPDMHYVKHQLVKNTPPSHHVKHDDTRVSPNCGRAEKQAASRHPGWLDLSLKRVLSVEFVELSP
jgi:hypothetical protein